MKASMLTKETVLDMGIVDRQFPEFKAGDAIEVSQIVKEGDKERIQKFAGDVICIRTNGIATTFTVRRMGAGGIGVERIFPYHAPLIKEIKLLKKGRVRRAKLFYVRDRIGKKARIASREPLTAQERE